jgi:hypothetical protein
VATQLNDHNQRRIEATAEEGSTVDMIAKPKPWNRRPQRNARTGHARAPRSGGHYAFLWVKEAHDNTASQPHAERQDQDMIAKPSYGIGDATAHATDRSTHGRRSSSGGHYAFLWRSEAQPTPHRSTAERGSTRMIHEAESYRRRTAHARTDTHARSSGGHHAFLWEKLQRDQHCIEAPQRGSTRI